MLQRLLTSKEASEDLAYGQIVIATARWILVLTGLLLALWNPIAIAQLRIQILVILLLAVANFYLHAQLLKRRPMLEIVAYGAAAADVAVISTLVASQGTFDSGLFIFYFPAILAFSVAFPTAMTALFATGTVGTYALIGLADIGIAEAQSEIQVLLTRLLMLAAVAVCGNLYWHVEARRRVELEQADELLSIDPQRRVAGV